MMLRRERSVWLDAGVGVRAIDIAARQGLVQLVDVAGCEFDTLRLGDAWSSTFKPTHTTVQIVLSGGLELRLGSHDEAAGSGSMAVHTNAPWNEHWLPRRQRILVVSWDAGRQQPALGVMKLNRFARRVWEEIAIGVERACNAEQSYAVVTRAREALRQDGVEVPDFALEAPPPAAQLLQQHINWAMCNLHQAPGWVDLERKTGLSARQLNRLWTANSEWLSGDGFRQGLLRRKLYNAAVLGYHADAKRLGLARALGYSSDRALDLALRSHGVPVPRPARR